MVVDLLSNSEKKTEYYNVVLRCVGVSVTRDLRTIK